MQTQTGLVLLALLHLLSSTKPFAAEAPKSNDQRVRDYVSAYNQHEVDTLLSLVSDDIQWLRVAGAKITVETQGKLQLRESLAGYFKSAPSAKSQLEWVQVTTSRVAALERAAWQGNSGPKSKTSLSVYEFRNGLICRLYYYPAEK